MLLWRGLTSEAEAMLPLVGEDWQKLAQARIATRRDAEGMQYLINTVPARLKSDPGLAYERYLYRVEQGALAGRRGLPAREVDLGDRARQAGHVDGAPRQPGAAGARGRRRRGRLPDRGAELRQPRAPDYADSEWVAGFIALTRMDDPKRAIGHFTRFQAVVATPISLGRAGYWLGKAFAAQPATTPAAENAFRMAAKYQTSFYGQLAAGRDRPAARRRAGRRRRAAGLARTRPSCSPRW